MAGVGEAASIIAVLQLADRIFAICSEYFSAVKDARKDVQRLQNEILGFRDVLASISDSLETAPEKKMMAMRKLRGSGLLNECYVELEDVAHTLESNKGMQRFGLRALRWPFTSTKLDETVDVLQRYKSSINLAMESDQSAAIQDIEEELLRHRIISWLSVVDPSTNHAKAFDLKHSKTCGWFLHGEEFGKWKKTRNSFLWLTGIPGSGKTVLCSTAIEELKLISEKADSPALAYFYFDFNDQTKQEPLNFLSSLCSQLCHWMRPLSLEIQNFFNDSHEGRQRPPMTQLLKLMEQIVKSLKESFIIVDALDECPDDGRRQTVMETLIKLANVGDCNLHVLASSRREPDITRWMDTTIKPREVALQRENTLGDISILVKDRISHDPRLNRWPTDIRDEIEEELVTNSQGMFRWVVCQFDILRGCLNISSIRQTLKSLPRTLNGTYERILNEIPNEYQLLLKRALVWLCLRRRALYVEELAEAIVIPTEDGLNLTEDLRLHDPWFVLDILGSLVTFTTSEGLNTMSESDLYATTRIQDATLNLRGLETTLKMFSNKTHINPPSASCCNRWARGKTLVTLAHASVRDFLLSPETRAGTAASYSVRVNEGHELISMSCLSYITGIRPFEHPKYDGVPKEDSVSQLMMFYSQWPLMSYAGDYWFAHVLSLEHNFPSIVNQKIARFLLCDGALTAWAVERVPSLQTYRLGKLSYEPGAEFYHLEVALHIISHAFYKMGADLSFEKGYWAELLCKRSPEPYSPRKLLLNICQQKRYQGDGGAAVFAAAWTGDLELLEVLLKNECNMWLKFDPKMVAIHAAAVQGHVNCLELLLRHAPNVEMLNGNGESLLFLAARHGRDHVVEFLIVKGAKVNSKTPNDWTPLYVAAEQQRISTVKLLLQHGATPNARTDTGMTAIYAAAVYGNTEIVQMLSEQNTNITDQVQEGWFMIHSIAAAGHVDVLRLLQSSIPEIDVRTLDGKTALHIAAVKASKEMVSALIDIGADVNAEDSSGETPIFGATANGRLTVVHELLDRGAKLDKLNKSGSTVTHVACDWGADQLVRLFLSKGASATGASIVAFANFGDVGTVKLLLANGANRLQRGQNYNRTALHWAALNGNIRMVKLLAVDKNDVEVEDNFGNKPLFYAHQRGNKRVIKRIAALEREVDEDNLPLEGMARHSEWKPQ